MSNSKVKIIIATHKKYEMPKDEIYLPVHVGAMGKKNEDGTDLDLGYVKDCSGENISEKNPFYCELTGLYWAWKNLENDYIGLVHYRRHFKGNKQSKNIFDRVLSKQEAEDLVCKYRVIVPSKRRYFIETLYSHYSHTHYAEQLDITRGIIQDLYPEYMTSYDSVLKQTWGYMFNMMIMEKSLLDEYCTWLFSVLEELENRIGTPDLSAFQMRFYGRVSEIIFNVWLNQQISSGKLSEADVKEVPVIHMEKINWIKKGTAFLRAKFGSEKYEGSF